MTELERSDDGHMIGAKKGPIAREAVGTVTNGSPMNGEQPQNCRAKGSGAVSCCRWLEHLSYPGRTETCWLFVHRCFGTRLSGAPVLSCSGETCAPASMTCSQG